MKKFFRNFSERDYYLLLLLTSLVVILRLAYFYLWPTDYGLAIEEHGRFGEAIFRGEGLSLAGHIPTAARTPLYPMWIAFIYSIFGFNYKFVLLGQIFWDALTAIFSFFLSYLIFENKRAAFLAVFLWAIYIPEFFYTCKMYAEISVTPVILAIIILVTMAIKNKIRNYYFFMLIGFLLGIAALIRPMFIFFIFFATATFYVASRDFESSLRKFFLMLFAFLLVLTPWIYRNYEIFGNLILTTTDAGDVLIYSNIIEKKDKSLIDQDVLKLYKYTGNYSHEKYNTIYHISPQYSETELNNIYLSGFTEFVINHPLVYFNYSCQRLLDSLFNYKGWKNRDMILTDFIFITVNFLFLIGTVFSFLRIDSRSKLLMLPMILMIFYKLLFQSLTHGAPRYLIPIWPLFIINLGYFLVFFRYQDPFNMKFSNEI